jgi:hypothetical protein
MHKAAVRFLVLAEIEAEGAGGETADAACQVQVMKAGFNALHHDDHSGALEGDIGDRLG